MSPAAGPSALPAPPSASRMKHPPRLSAFLRNGVLCLALGCALRGADQNGTTEPSISPRLLTELWPAWWIAHPSGPATDFGVFHYRKTFSLAVKPERFVIHVSADNRYRLFANGVFVATGPAQGDLFNWHFETVDLAPYLRAGNNVLAAVVWNGGVARPMAQISHRTGFILQSDDPANKAVNTDGAWKVTEDPAYRPIVYNHNDERLRWNYYVAGATERVDAALYPWGWELPAFNDSAWLPAAPIDQGSPARVLGMQRWQLTPRSVPLLPEAPQRFARVARAEGVEAGAAFVQGSGPMRIPANSKAAVLLDQGGVTTGYPVLRVAGGRGAVVQLTYSEALYDGKGAKGNRNEFEGKTVMGPEDVFLPDGAPREYRPLWTRNWRWVQLDIQTRAEPLLIEDASSLLCVYPATRLAVFESDSRELTPIWDATWRTLALNAQETFISDIAWERLQYVADTKMQALAWLNLCGDDRLVRLAIEEIDASRAPCGLTQSRYPANLEQFIPTFSLFWVSMVHDHWRYRGDDAFTRRFLPGIRNVLGWWEEQVRQNGNRPVPWSWTPSAIADKFLFSLTLQESAELFEHFGGNQDAAHFRELASAINQEAYASNFDPSRGLLHDTPELGFTDRVNLFAVLADAVPHPNQRALMERMLGDTSAVKSDPSDFMFLHYYVGRALKKTGLGDRYLGTLGPWEEMMHDGMQTFGELAKDPRSECHPWGTSPGFELLATVAGIEPASPGFRTVRIEPSLGSLNHVHARMPHPAGPIEVWLDRTGDGLRARVSLPPGLDGVFVWKGQERPIRGNVDLSL